MMEIDDEGEAIAEKMKLEKRKSKKKMKAEPKTHLKE